MNLWTHKIEKMLNAIGLGTAQVQRLTNFNINEITKSGFYYISNCKIGENTTEDGYLLNLNYNTNYKVQIYISPSFSNSKDIQYRKKSGGTWDNWNNLGDRKLTTGVEFETGRIIDGKVEYCKRIDTGALPNKTQKQIAIGIDVKNITIQKYEGMARNSSNGACKPLPYVNATYTNYNVQVDIWETGHINITTNNDWSSYDTSYIDLYYTKN